jgi:hypothetical protein
MSECRALSEAHTIARRDNLLLEDRQLRAVANYFRTFHGADSFVSALTHARALSGTDELANAPLWNQIAEKISHLETSELLERCLKRQIDPKSVHVPDKAPGTTP